MNPRQRRFVAEYAIDGNAAAAARRAGYSAQSARVNGPRLLSNAAVQTAIQRTQLEAASRLKVEREDVLQGLLEAVEIARIQTDPGSLIRAWTEIGRVCGFFARSEVLKIGVNTAAQRMIERLETLSDSDLIQMVEAAPALPA